MNPPTRSARDLIAHFFDREVPIVPRESLVTVGTSLVPVGSYARQRVAIGFSNAGANAIIVGFSSTITASGGYVVPAGGFLSFTWFLDGELVMQDFFAISGTAAQTLYVCESVLIGI